MSSREAVDRALKEFEREFPDEGERMTHACLGLVAEAASRLRRAGAAASSRRTEGCRICAYPKREVVNRMLVVGKWSSRGLAKRTTFARQDVEKHRRICLSSGAKAG